MKFDTLKEKCEYYRNRENNTLLPNTPVLVMCDGRSFSNYVKKHFKLPFDDKFINAMNETAKYICEQVQGTQFAYVQSDEISIFINDYKTETSDSFFGFRKCKLLSTIASLATVKFNRIIERDWLNEFQKNGYTDIAFDQLPLLTFDCKVWNVPNENDVFAWFLYRQIDCVRNSKQQTAQTYLPHKQLLNKSTDEQIELLLQEKNIDWHTIDQGKKYGRFISKEEKQYEKDLPNGQHIEYVRNEFSTKPSDFWAENASQIKNLLNIHNYE